MRRLIFALALLSAGAAGAVQLPLRINFQGKLLDPATSLPKNGTFNMTFAIYPAATLGTASWTESQSNVAVNNGVFSVQLGSVNPLNQELFAGASAYLGITVGTDSEMTPRQYLAMSPYAFTAMQLAQTTDIRINPGVAYSTFSTTGNLFIAAGVTAGTATITGSLTASSGTFTATGASQYSLETSSGIVLDAGMLNVKGSGGVVSTSFTGDGSDVTGTAPLVAQSSGSASVTLTSGVERPIAFSTITVTAASKNLLIMTHANVGKVNSGNSCVFRLYRGTTAGTACNITGQTLIMATLPGVPASTTNQTSLFMTAVDVNLGAGTWSYCTSLKCGAAYVVGDHALTLIEIAPASTTGISP